MLSEPDCPAVGMGILIFWKFKLQSLPHFRFQKASLLEVSLGWQCVQFCSLQPHYCISVYKLFWQHNPWCQSLYTRVYDSVLLLRFCSRLFPNTPLQLRRAFVWVWLHITKKPFEVWAPAYSNCWYTLHDYVFHLPAVNLETLITLQFLSRYSSTYFTHLLHNVFLEHRD